MNTITQNNYTTLSFEQAKDVREKYSPALFYFEKVKNEIGTKLTEQEKGEDFCKSTPFLVRLPISETLATSLRAPR